MAHTHKRNAKHTHNNRAGWKLDRNARRNARTVEPLDIDALTRELCAGTQRVMSHSVNVLHTR